MRTVFFFFIVLFSFEIVNKLTPPTLTATLQWAFPVVSKKLCLRQRAETKAHCKARRNIFIRIEIQAGNPESAGF